MQRGLFNPGLLIGGLILLASSLVAEPRSYAEEVFELLDGTKLIGTLVHFYEGTFSIRLPNGSTLQLPTAKIKQIHLKLPPARKELGTPQKTFDRLRQAALKGDLETYVDCHSVYYQMFLSHQISMNKPAEFTKRLKSEWGSTALEVIGTSVTGNTAVMKVRRKNDKDSQEGELRFLKENNEWKMILPL